MQKATRQTFRVNAGGVHIEKDKNKVVLCDFFGPVSGSSLCALGKMAADFTKGSKSIVFRMDRALVLADGPLAFFYDGVPHQRISAAFVVSPVQFDVINEHARLAAKRGTVRAVFLQSELNHALEWAELEALCAHH